MNGLKNRIPVILLSLLVSSVSLAQSWNFIKPNERYHFKHKDDTIPLNTILIDSTKTEGNNTTNYLNRLFLPCDTCSSEGFFLDNQPGFLQREFVYSQVSSTVQLTNPEQYTIYLPDNELKEWWFDEAKTQRAILESVTSENVFGIEDSIATINIDGEPKIKIAKNLGLIRYFEYELSGLENARLGECLPGWKDFYEFEVGDVFQYEFSEEYWQAPWRPYGYFKKEVKSIHNANDTIEISWQVRRIEWWTTYADTTIIRDWEEKQIITKEDISNTYPNQKKEISWGEYAIPLFSKHNDTISLIYETLKELPPFTGVIHYNNLDSIFSNQPSYPYGNRFRYVFDIGLGISDYAFVLQAESYDYESLIGYVKNGDTTGIVYPDEYYVVPEIIDTTHVKNTEFIERLAQVFPNPSKGSITFDLGKETEASIRIYTLEGKLVEQFETKSNQIQNLQQLNSGIYIISIQLKESLQQIKWIKQ